MNVRAWTEQVSLPTYEIGMPEKNPIFLEKRVYQGSSGAVYPHPVIEKIEDKKIDKEWEAVYLENKYLKIMILPQLGGRIQMAYDKMKERHFIYYNQVIKPALVGLTGPWISGGIEFNWPQHHRPSTYDPSDFKIEQNKDGSITVWCNEVERMFRTRGMAGFTLYPENAYLEIKVKLYNRTNHPQTFLWWANPAVKVNDEYQSVFPPDVNAVFDHGKRDVSEFPIAKGTYYKVDYSPGTDISRYKNIPVPTSYMAISSDYDFLGGYENDSKGGVLHIANHHISPGKKQWTWGHSDFGQAWDRNLTDEDGPYIELMCGVYTDNQPDFSWLMPGEEKSFSQYFMPYRDLGVVKNANKEALLNLEVNKGKAIVKVYTTAEYPAGTVLLTCDNQILLNDIFDFHPGTSYEKTIELPSEVNPSALEISVKSAEGIRLVTWSTKPNEKKEMPEPAKKAKEPNEIESNEQLYLAGLHLEQYRHATYDPRPYYEEAIHRDSKDSRCNNALGLWYLRRGKFEKAEIYFTQAIETLTERNPNPIEGEPFFNLGIAQRYLNKNEEAYKAFYKSVWNAAWMDNGYFQLARLEALNKKWEQALDVIERALIRNWHNHKARQLKVSILRNLGRKEDALVLCNASLQLDQFNFSIYFEKFLLDNDKGALLEMKLLLRANIHNYIEYALDYAYAGLFEEAIEFLSIGIEEQGTRNVYPMALYYQAWFQSHLGLKGQSSKTLMDALNLCPDYCFPNQPEAVVALEWAISENPGDYKALYYLGNLWYANRQYEDAIECWEVSRSLNCNFPTVRRNLALAYFNKLHRQEDALNELEAAFHLDTSDARILMELDQLYKKINRSADERLAFLEKHRQTVLNRDDLFLELVTLNNIKGNYSIALDLITHRNFHPWEGGEGKVTGQYLLALMELAKLAIQQKNFEQALGHLKATEKYPHNLGEGKLFGAQENDIWYLFGCTYEGLGQAEDANRYWKKASMGTSKPLVAMFYNDQQPDKIFYQGLALLKLGKKADANERFNKLIKYGEEHKNDNVKVDFFAVSLPDLLIWEEDLQKRNKIHCNYMVGLGLLGLGQKTKADKFFNKVLKEDYYHIGSRIHLAFDLINM